MAYATKSIASRIEWCQRQSTQVCASRERAEWQAEVEGLRDALFNRDHTTQYQHGPPSVFERYALGLQDGHALLRTAAIDLHFAPPARTATTVSHVEIDGTGDASTRRIRIVGLTRRARKYLQKCRVTGNGKE